MTGAERVRLCRARKRAAELATVANLPATVPAAPLPSPTETLQAVTSTFHVTPARRPVASYLLVVAALALAVTGCSMNAWFARSLGASDAAGMMFLAVGIAADLVALTLPSVAAGLWQNRERATATVAWLVWVAVFAFALLSAVGFGATNISDVAAARGERVTPAIETARAALGDAQASRDRECRGGVGAFCRQRESAVAAARTGLDTAMAGVAATADPQTEQARRLVNWISRGTLAPTADDFAMVRLLLLSLLPQIGGILAMIARRRA
jgi:hypothetical protein